MTRKRDLSGFGVTPAPTKPTDPTPVPPPPERRSAEPEAAPITQRATRTKKADAKKRITLSLPTQVASMLRTAAEQQQRIYLDIILSAFILHADDIDASLALDRSKRSAMGSRRRAMSGRTQIPLNILSEDLRVLDQRVKAANLDRSAYITELLLLELKS